MSAGEREWTWWVNHSELPLCYRWNSECFFFLSLFLSSFLVSPFQFVLCLTWGIPCCAEEHRGLEPDVHRFESWLHYYWLWPWINSLVSVRVSCGRHRKLGDLEQQNFIIAHFGRPKLVSLAEKSKRWPGCAWSWDSRRLSVAVSLHALPPWSHRLFYICLCGHPLPPRIQWCHLGLTEIIQGKLTISKSLIYLYRDPVSIVVFTGFRD